MYFRKLYIKMILVLLENKSCIVPIANMKTKLKYKKISNDCTLTDTKQ